ncbi:ABC transporter permease [Pseudomonas sp. C1C7]|uniref:ABC transporter permease n=1 Tax=Pseudomonas sp. C1C7 TaxID=2735272 RepID=UPI001586C3EF|nr:ABC transporter permease [Pseudomonas sp. C1C7]NUT78560.1 ABC transporter permease [Pseudomonas sp. C1C7]
MSKNIILRTATLALIFIKEQIKEPISLIWIMLSPCAFFYFLAVTKQDADYFQGNYPVTSAWFYSYVASSVALFGFAFYIIGRRESGFIRSFVYSKKSRGIFICSHFLAYSIVSIAYCSTFYLVTKPPFGNYDLPEALTIIFRFYICFLMFCSFGVIFTLLPINFQNSNTLLSVCSFLMLIFGVMGASYPNDIIKTINMANPLTIASQLMVEKLSSNLLTLALIALSVIFSTFIFLKHLKINPVWSRY